MNERMKISGLSCTVWKAIALTAILLMLPPGLCSANKPPDDAGTSKVLKEAYRIQVPFIANMGQIESEDVAFYAKTFGGTVFVEKSGILTYNVPAKEKRGVVIKEFFTDKTIHVEGLERSPTRVSSFKGKDKSHWKARIPTYDSIESRAIYNGIDLRLKAYGNNVEKLFTVLPKANPNQIRVKLLGIKGLKVKETGELEMMTDLGSLSFTKPIAYQKIGGEKKSVSVAYAVFEGNTYGFKLGNYDKKRPVIIDPLLASTFIGRSGSEYALSIIQLDASGNVYLAGRTPCSDYPTTTGAYDETHSGGTDIFVSKLDNDLTSLVASTFIGGSYYDHGYSITLDASGNLYLAGSTSSSDYPTTNGAYNETHNGGTEDAVVSKLDSDLTSLLASTFIGGSAWDYGYTVRLDGNGNVYVAGATESSDYPTTAGAYDEDHNGGADVFISKLDNALTSLVASTFIGGTDGDWYTYGDSFTLDESESVYVTGHTRSSDYPTTTGAYDEDHNGGDDVFISKLDSDLTSLVASTFIGGSDGDYGQSIALDGSGNVYVAGSTESSIYPTTSGAYDESHNGARDVFISKLDNGLASLVASTFIGGSDGDYGESITLDGSGDVYLAGGTESTDFPTTTSAYDESHNGGSDVFVSKLDHALTSVMASTFIGGSDPDVSYSSTLDASGNVYLAGGTESTDFPTTNGAYDESHNGSWDVFVSKLDSDLSAETSKWAITYGGTSNEMAYSVQQTADGGYIVAGWTDSFGTGEEDLWITKVDSDGTIDWQKAYGGTGSEGMWRNFSFFNHTVCIQETGNHGFVVATYTDSFGAGNDDFWILELSSDGNVNWQKTYGGSGNDIAYSIQRTTDGGYVVLGWTASYGAGDWDFWVLKLNSDGSVNWQKTYGGSEQDHADSIQETTDGGYVLVGETRSFGAGGYDFWVLKLNSDGSVNWQKTYGGSDHDHGRSIQETTDNGFIVVGETWSFGTGNNDFWVLKLNSGGEVTWQKAYGGSDNETAFSVLQTTDGDFLVSGMGESFGEDYNSLVIKLDSDADVVWEKVYDGFINSMQETKNGSYIAAGWMAGMPLQDVWALMLNPCGDIPGCSVIGEGSSTVSDTSVLSQNTNVIPQDTSVIPLDTSISPQDTSVETSVICFFSPVACTDTDGDGYGVCPDCGIANGCTYDGDDCNDGDETVHPGAAEICDGVDDDCDAGTPDGSDEPWYGDPTTCGQGVCAGTGVLDCVGGIQQNTCQTGSPTEDPEVSCSDGLDNDCDGLTDGDDPDCGVSCVDSDGDGYGVCPNCGIANGCTHDGDDCDDSNDTVHPGAAEMCNGVDDDCDAGTPDGSGEPWYGDPTTCGQGVCSRTGVLDCVGGMQQDTCQTGSPTEDPEVSCSDGLDNDCDGLTDGDDPDCGVSCVDSDGDGYGVCPNCGTANGCNYDGNDCDDGDNTIYPGADEILCDGIDQDCDGADDCSAPAAQWARTYGLVDTNEFALDVHQTLDCGYVMVGQIDSEPYGNENVDTWVLKLNADGSVDWEKKYDGGDEDNAPSIQPTSDGGYVVAGRTYSDGQNPPDTADSWVMKLDASGNIEWQYTYGGSGQEYANAIQQTLDSSGQANGYIVAGSTYQSFGGDPFDGWILRLDSSGSVVWEKRYHGEDRLEYTDYIQQTSDAGYIVAGYVVNPDSGTDVWIMKLYPDGQPSPGDYGVVEWEKIFPIREVGDDYYRSFPTSIQQTDDDGNGDRDDGYVVAIMDSQPQEPNATNDIRLLKLDSDGAVTWQKTYDGEAHDVPYSIQQTSDRGYVVTAGTTSFGAGANDFWVLKLYPDGSPNPGDYGEIEWQRTYGGSAHDTPYSIRQTYDDGYVVVGTTQSFGAGDNEILALKLDAYGNVPGCSIMGSSSAIVSDKSGFGGEPISSTSQVTLCNVSGPDLNIEAENTQAETSVICPDEAHEAHWDNTNGPHLGDDCTVCHESQGGGVPFADGATELANTTVCETCHSPDGAFDGVDDAVIGAKANWDNGVYDTNGTLKPGKEKWCAGCHDDAPASSQPTPAEPTSFVVDNPDATFVCDWGTSTALEEQRYGD
ncbi:MAG: MopE-related protein, partial [Thermodesulfobacteriota bacterium]|nr:MopE-related protein [Thermodesulfobacteriota bacterium]